MEGARSLDAQRRCLWFGLEQGMILFTERSRADAQPEGRGTFPEQVVCCG